jgi:hypothetical protein
MGIVDPIRAEEAFGLQLVQYAGDWVAVQDRAVLDNDKNLGALVGRLNGTRDTAEIFKVREDPSAPCFY